MFRVIRCNIVALFFVFFFSAAHAANVYIDGGNIENDAAWNGMNGHSYSCAHGTGAGYSTIQAAVTVMASGDDLYIRGGIYNESNIVIGTNASGTAQDYSSIQSYPGEWAIVDAQYAGAGTYRSVFQKNGLSYFTFERLEITGGGASDAQCTYGAGIKIYNAVNVVMRYLYVHDNYARSEAGATAGIHLLDNDGAASRNVTIEFCYIKANGNPFGDRNSANVNIAIYSDYKYSNTVDLDNCMANNIIRYNRIDGEATGGSIPVAFMHKGMQRLTGWAYGEDENPSDNLPNGTTGREYGDKIHHNVMINHTLGMRLDQDYVQAYNNIIWNVDVGASGESSRDGGIHTKDYYSERRGSFKPCLYNNTIYAANNKGIAVGTVGSSWSSSELPSYFADTWAYNNLIQSYDDGYDWSGISIQSDESPKSTYPLDLIHLSRNFFYQPDGTNIIYINTTKFTPAQIMSTSSSDVVWAKRSPSPFIGSSGADKYIANGNYQLDQIYTIANGGIGGEHSYLSGVTIPSYIGAVNPSDSEWVSGVLSMDPEWFRAQNGGSIPTWIEDSSRQPPVISPPRDFQAESVTL